MPNVILYLQNGTPEQNNRLPKESCCGYDELTNSQNGNRSRYTSGIFLSQIYTSLGEHRPKSIEFAIRSIRGNKARNRTNNTSLFCEVVEAVSLPIHLGDTFHKFTKTQNTMKKSTSKSNVISYLKDGTTFVCAQGVSLARAEEIKAHIETNPNEFSYRDVARVEIQTSEGVKMSNQNKIYAVTIDLKLDEQRYFQAVQAFFKDKKTAKRFLKGSPFKGNIETVDPTDYTLEFLPASALGQVPAVLFKGSRFYAEMAEVKPRFEILMPDYHFEVKKFDETELFNKMMKVGGMYA